MAISRMLKIQLFAHNSIKEEVKRFLRELGVVEVTAVSGVGGDSMVMDGEEVPDILEKKEQIENSISFLERFAEKPSFFEKLSRGPLTASDDELEELDREISPVGIWGESGKIDDRIRSSKEELSKSKEIVSSLQGWRGLEVSLEALSTQKYELQMWTLPEKQAAAGLEDIYGKFELCHFESCLVEDGKVHLAVILPGAGQNDLTEALKEIGGFHNIYRGVEGTPAQVIENEKLHWDLLERKIREAEAEAGELAGILDKLYILSDYYGEKLGLTEIESKFYHTASTSLIEGWIRALDKKKLEKSISSNFDDIEFAFREPLDDEEPPIHLDNNAATRPSEFVTTLYGRPVYSEVDPTPLLAPFFILFFAMCLSDAGYGIILAAFAAFIILKFKPSGGFALLMKLLFAGGIVTAIVGVLSGGIFGIGPESFPPFMRQFILVNPLKEPMKMLNISFVMGLVHMLFGMGVKMTAKIKEGMIADALLDNLCWIIFLIVLAPLGYSVILGGYVPDVVMWWSKRAALVFVFIIFITGGRKKKSIINKVLGGLVGFYDVVGYFGDVLSYARLLALGLATSAIAIAVNDIAKMVIGMPYYAGYLAAILILLGGHTFNLAVNTLGGFVHSARLQYLEFFSKFFTGGGKEFKPFRNERHYSIIKNQNSDKSV